MRHGQKNIKLENFVFRWLVLYNF